MEDGRWKLKVEDGREETRYELAEGKPSRCYCE